MKKSSLVKALGIGMILLSTASVAAATFAWFVVGGVTKNETIDGKIGLRSYFYGGSGKLDDPYEITEYRHLRNLSILQNLGILSNETYFQIGTTINGELYCHPQFDAHGDFTGGEQFLDMSGNAIAPIGTECTPFVGHFNGNNFPIRDVRVEGTPEDVGLFGYVAYEASVENVILDSPTVKLVSYASDATQTELFAPDVTKIFDNNAPYMTANTNVRFHDRGSSTSDYSVKSVQGLSGIDYLHLNYPDNMVQHYKTQKDGTQVPDGHIYKGWFEISLPDKTNDAPFEYSWKASSRIVRELNLTSENNWTYNPTSETSESTSQEQTTNRKILLNLDLDMLLESDGAGGFNNPDVKFDTRISIYATYKDSVSKFSFSRVVQSYTIEFVSDGYKEPDPQEGQNGYSMTIYCDYNGENYEDNPVKSNYHHGNNIGFLIGHTDGTVKNCYVYNGTMNFATSDPNHPLESETDTGLIGEIGTNVLNTLDDGFDAGENLDTGVLNFTKIYKGIRKNVVSGDIVKAGNDGNNFMAYEKYMNDKTVYEKYNQGQTYNSSLFENYDSLFSSYESYLRYITLTNSGKHYVVYPGVSIGQNAQNPDSDPDYDRGTWHNYTIPANKDIKDEMNSIQLIGGNLIEDGDTDETNRGLGVFKVATANGGSYTNIYNGSTNIDKVYFSTAEYDHTVTGQGDDAWPDYNPFRPTSLPSYTDNNSYNYPFSRDYNYCFELDLSKNTEQITNKNYYMSNTSSTFLARYLHTKLITAKGENIAMNTSKCGFNFFVTKKDPQHPEKKTIEYLTNLSSYMVLGKPENSKTITLNNQKYPANSVVFTMKNPGNVSVVGKSDNITVYKFKPGQSNIGLTPLYTMFAKNLNEDEQHRYFEYHIETPKTEGNTDETVHVDGAGTMKDSSDSGSLYGHIFKLKASEPGEMYCIGSAPNKAQDAKLFYLAVQGQDEGEAGDAKQQADFGEEGSKLENVDFLLPKNPNKLSDRYVRDDTLNVANLYFRADCNSDGGEITFGPDSTDKTKIGMTYTDNNQLVRFLQVTSTNNNPVTFYVNETDYTINTAGSRTIVQS